MVPETSTDWAKAKTSPWTVPLMMRVPPPKTRSSSLVSDCSITRREPDRWSTARAEGTRRTLNRTVIRIANQSLRIGVRLLRVTQAPERSRNQRGGDRLGRRLAERGPRHLRDSRSCAGTDRESGPDTAAPGCRRQPGRPRRHRWIASRSSNPFASFHLIVRVGRTFFRVGAQKPCRLTCIGAGYRSVRPRRRLVSKRTSRFRQPDGAFCAILILGVVSAGQLPRGGGSGEDHHRGGRDHAKRAPGRPALPGARPHS